MNKIQQLAGNSAMFKEMINFTLQEYVSCKMRSISNDHLWKRRCLSLVNLKGKGPLLI